MNKADSQNEWIFYQHWNENEKAKMRMENTNIPVECAVKDTELGSGGIHECL